MSSIDLSVVRVCEEKCDSCIFTPQSPISPARLREYMEIWQKSDTFQNCHKGTVTGDSALMCRGFYDWCLSSGWKPTIVTLGEWFDRIHFVPVPEVEAGEGAASTKGEE